MKEFIRILGLYDKIDKQRLKAALATVLCVEGSSYRRPGARMLITSDGKWEGAISGGCLEGDVLRKARNVMNTHEKTVITYSTMDDTDDIFGIRLGCNGIIKVLLEPVDFNDPANAVLILKNFIDIKERSVLATVFSADESTGLSAGQRILYRPDNESRMPDWMMQNCEDALETGKSHAAIYAAHGAVAEILYEIIEPQMQILISGAGYDVLPLMNIARELGWRVILSDECQVQLLSKQKSCADAIVCGTSDKVLAEVDVTTRTAAVLMSHNFQSDKAMLLSLLQTDIPYIGILGPAKRFEKMADELAAKGYEMTPADNARIHAPIGLDIGAETPEEIALSIITEIKASFTARNGQSLKHRYGPIHEREESGLL